MLTVWISSILKRRPPLRVQHPLFGDLVFSRRDGWINDAFELWGARGVELLIDAGVQGPSPEQARAFQRFEAQRESLLPRCLAEVEKVRKGMNMASSRFEINCLTIPSLRDGRQGRLWTLWFDVPGDDHFMYGVQTQDNWATLVGFADD